MEEIDEALTSLFDFVEVEEAEPEIVDPPEETEQEEVTIVPEDSPGCQADEGSDSTWIIELDWLEPEKNADGADPCGLYNEVVFKGGYLSASKVCIFQREYSGSQFIKCQGFDIQDSIGDKDGNKDVGCKPSWGRYL